MNDTTSLIFKIASEDWEFEYIHKLNYATFVEEIPQHHQNEDRKLIDKFHQQNIYLICLRGRQLEGMIALRDRRPFSLDLKVKDLDAYLPGGRKVVEIRLLSVQRSWRNGQVFLGLLKLLSEFSKTRGYDLGIISGTTRQFKLYKSIGFVPFGPLVGEGEAQFQPMYVTLESFTEHVGQLLRADASQHLPAESFLPGPVSISHEVREALGQHAVSHRSAGFMKDVQRIKHKLCRMVNARRVEILLGTGTLANDVVAGQLSLLDQPGVVLVNGEFGERLVDHATRAGLTFEILALPWGSVFERREIEAIIARNPAARWLWATHCETSTGVLNDLAMLKDICRPRGIHLCLDCCSSIGTMAIDLESVYFAASVSGKGLGAFPGLALVFYNHDIRPATKQLPRYLDLALYAENDGIPFTHSSNLYAALRTALKRFDDHPPFPEMAATAAWLRAQLRADGFTLVAPEAHASPAIVSIIMPPGIPAARVGTQLEQDGLLLSYRSSYLRERNWIQISLMGSCTKERLTPVLAALKNAALAAPVDGAQAVTPA